MAFLLEGGSVGGPVGSSRATEPQSSLQCCSLFPDCLIGISGTERSSTHRTASSHALKNSTASLLITTASTHSGNPMVFMAEDQPMHMALTSAATTRACAESDTIVTVGIRPQRRREKIIDFYENNLLFCFKPSFHCNTASLSLPSVTCSGDPSSENLPAQQLNTDAIWDSRLFSSVATAAQRNDVSLAATAGGAPEISGSATPTPGGGSASAPPPTITGRNTTPAAAGAGGRGTGSSKSTGVQLPQRTMKEVLDYAAGQAFKGGIAGASAQVLNVFAFMWLRTTMNYQYRYGKSTLGAIKQLYAEGGIVRFYRGLLPALMQSPLSRFGDTAANVGVLAALDSKPATRDLPVGVKTAVASCGAAAWRFFLMPIDAWKTTKQVEGGSGLKILARKVRQHGFTKLYHGSVAAMGATWVGHYPWFFVHNYLSEKLPPFDGVPQGRHVRYGLIGFVSSVVSDTCSNSIRVLKTTKQTSIEPMTYPQALREVLAKDGVTGLLFRGLGTRILTNGLQGMVFSVGWKAIQSQLSK